MIWKVKKKKLKCFGFDFFEKSKIKNREGDKSVAKQTHKLRWYWGWNSSLLIYIYIYIYIKAKFSFGEGLNFVLVAWTDYFERLNRLLNP